MWDWLTNSHTLRCHGEAPLFAAERCQVSTRKWVRFGSSPGRSYCCTQYYSGPMGLRADPCLSDAERGLTFNGSFFCAGVCAVAQTRSDSLTGWDERNRWAGLRAGGLPAWDGAGRPPFIPISRSRQLHESGRRDWCV